MSAERVVQLIEAGLWLRMSGDVDGARKLFAQALKLDPQNAQARQLLAAPARTSAVVTRQELPRELHHTPEPRLQDGTFRIDGQPSPIPPSIAPLVSAPLRPETAWDSAAAPSERLQSPPVQRGVKDALDILRDENMPVPFSRTPAPLTDTRREAQVQALRKEAEELLRLDDHTGAVEVLTRAQHLDPDNVELGRLKANSEGVLVAMYESKLGVLTSIPRVRIKEADIIWLNLDHRAGFVLAQIDGQVSYDELFLVSGMSRIDTARILAQLSEEGVIGVA